MLNKNVYCKYFNMAKSFSSKRLVFEIDILEKLIDDDSFSKSLFIDDVLDIYEAYRDECVRRVRLSCVEGGCACDNLLRS